MIDRVARPVCAAVMLFLAVLVGSFAADVGAFTPDASVDAGAGTGGGAPSGAAGGDLAGTYPDPTIGANAVALGTDTTGNYATSSSEGGAAADTVLVGGATPSSNGLTILADTYAQMRTALALVIGTNVQAYNANLDTYAAQTPGTDGLAVVGSANLKRGEWVQLGTMSFAASAPPQALTDAQMTGQAAGGSVSAPTIGLLASSYSAITNETGTASPGAGLGAAAAADRPYPVADYAGIYSDLNLPCQLTKSDGDVLIVADLIPLATVADLDAPVELFLSYRSDLGANAKWRAWPYYRAAATGRWTSVTPTATASSVNITCPRVTTAAAVTVRGSFGAPAIGNVAAELGANSVTLPTLVQAAARYGFIGRSSSGAGNYEEVAGTAAGFAVMTAADASAQRTALALVIGTNVQAQNATLQALATAGKVVDIQTFTGSGTWSKPTLTSSAALTQVTCIGGGGGGGSGRKGAAGAARGGGTGGAGGGIVRAEIPTAALAGTETVTIGAGGAGGAAQTTNTTAGVAGTSGGDSTFGSLLRATGGPNGLGGTATNAAGATGVQGGGSGGGNNGSAAGSAGSIGVSGGGGSGGGISGADAESAGGAGGGGGGAAGGAAGAATAAGTVGGTSTALVGTGGGGGGGGGGSKTGSSGVGAAGGTYGGGGGGSGAALDGQTGSGVGGAGAAGFCIAITWL